MSVPASATGRDRASSPVLQLQSFVHQQLDRLGQAPSFGQWAVAADARGGSCLCGRDGLRG